MKGLTAKIVICVTLALAFMLPVGVSIWMSYRVALAEQRLRTGILAAQVLHRAHTLSAQIADARHALERRADKNPCSAGNIALMRSLAIGEGYLQDVGYVEGGKLRCSAYGNLGDGFVLGPADYRSSRGAWIYKAVKLPFSESEKFFVITESGSGYSSMVMPELILDIGEASREAAIALIAISSRQVIMQHDSIDLRGMPPLIRERGEMTWRHDGAMGAVKFSPTRDYAAVVVSSASAFDAAWRKAAMWLVPFGALLGAALVVLVVLRLRQRKGLLWQLDRALRCHELSLAYMPIVELESGKWVGAEALMRWQRDGEWIAPDRFIPLAERHRRIRRVTERMLDLLVADARALPPEFAAALYFSINLSAEDLADPDIAQRVRAVRQACGVDGIMVEATEGVLLQAERVVPNIDRLRDLGMRVAIDDFGTGYSSLSYLGSLDVDCIKIDKSFVSAIGTQSVRGHVVAHIIDMARDVGLAVIAEGVETQEQAAYLAARGVQYAQGWLFGKAAPMREFVAAMHADRVYHACQM